MKYLIEVAVVLESTRTAYEMEKLASAVGAAVERQLREKDHVNSVTITEVQDEKKA